MKVLKTTIFVGAYYAMIELDDGRHVELRHGTELTDQEWLDKAKVLPADEPIVETKELATATDDDLIAEVKKRAITQDKIFSIKEVSPK